MKQMSIKFNEIAQLLYLDLSRSNFIIFKYVFTPQIIIIKQILLSPSTTHCVNFI